MAVRPPFDLVAESLQAPSEQAGPHGPRWPLLLSRRLALCQRTRAGPRGRASPPVNGETPGCRPAPHETQLIYTQDSRPADGTRGGYWRARLEPVALPCGELALAIALCGPGALRTVRSNGARRVAVEFALPSIGRLDIAVPAADDRSNRTIRELRSDRRAYARVLALLARDAQSEAMAGA